MDKDLVVRKAKYRQGMAIYSLQVHYKLAIHNMLANSSILMPQSSQSETPLSLPFLNLLPSPLPKIPKRILSPIYSQQFQLFFYLQNKTKNTPMSQKTFFGCMDYRNAKFQGSIREHIMDGIGIILDNEYMMSLTSWKNQMPYGPSLIVFPNRDYLFGKIKNKQLQENCTYVTARGETFCFNFVNGVSENVAYIDSNQAIIGIRYNQGRMHVVQSYPAPKQNDSSSKWRIISDILRSQMREEDRNYKNYVKAMLQSQFSDVLECSENANLTFIGFKNTVSLGVKFDKNHRVKQVGNFQEFPRNLEFGRKFTDNSMNDVKVEQGKFSQPEEVFVYKGDQRNSEALRQTENYFKKGTNFKNQFVKLNVIVDISKYFSRVKKDLEILKVTDLGQKFQELNSVESVQQEQLNKVYNIEQVKKDIYDAANRRNRVNRSPTKRQFEIYDHEIPKSSPRKHSKERYQYVKQSSEEVEKIFKPIPPPKNRYLYVNEAEKTRSPIKSQYILKYRDLTPEVSDFDRNIDQYQRRNMVSDRNVDRIISDRMFVLKNEDEHIRERAMLRNREELYSPAKRIIQEPPRNMPRSPIRTLEKNSDEKFSQSKYQNYLQYKNRKRLEEPAQVPKQSQEKYKIYERKVLGPNNLTPDKTDRLKYNLGPQQITLNPLKSTDNAIPTRFKKNYKYL